MKLGSATTDVLQHSPFSMFLWLTLAAIFGGVFALIGISSIYAVLAGCLLVAFAMLVTRSPTAVLCALILGLGLCPFNWGLENGPKMFGDELLLLPYLFMLPALLIFTNRRWYQLPTYFVVGFTTFLASEVLSLSLLAGDLVALRNLFETFLLGPMLLVLCLQETANGVEEESVSLAIVWATVIIAALTILERATGRNPIMEHSTDILYLSPEIARATEGVYRPYVTFFHPSESATFMALGAPFVIRHWSRNRSVWSACLCAIFGAGLFVNATRGVWVAVALAIVLFSKTLWKLLLAVGPLLLLIGAGLYAAFSSTPFIQRLTDPNNLYSRFVFWQLTGKIFIVHPILGVGHMQFGKIYLDYVRDLSNLAQFDIGKVSVIDNLYLTTAVEQGVVGIFGLLAFLAVVALLLKQLHSRLASVALFRQASLVQASAMALMVYCVAGMFADVHEFTKATKYLCLLVGFGLGVGIRHVRQAEQAAVDEPSNIHRGTGPRCALADKPLTPRVAAAPSN